MLGKLCAKSQLPKIQVFRESLLTETLSSLSSVPMQRYALAQIHFFVARRDLEG